MSPPVIIKHPTDEVTEVYSSIALECNIQGYGYINVEWRKLGAHLPNTAFVRNKKLTNGVSSILKIKEIIGFYDGMYCCVASNIAGQTTAKYAKLSVNGKPDTSQLYHMNNIYTLYCFFACSTLSRNFQALQEYHGFSK